MQYLKVMPHLSLLKVLISVKLMHQFVLHSDVVRSSLMSHLVRVLAGVGCDGRYGTDACSSLFMVMSSGQD